MPRVLLRRAACVCTAGLLIAGSAAAAPSTGAITGDSLTGFVLPVEPVPGDIRLKALRAWTWEVHDTTRLLLEGEVTVFVGGYRFGGRRTVVWINRIPSAAGPINQIAAYFEQLDDPGQASGLGASGHKLLITGSARGTVELDVALLRSFQPPADGLLATGRARLAEYLARLDIDPPPLAQRPQRDNVPPVPFPVPKPGGPVYPLEFADPAGTGGQLDASATPSLFVPQGTLWFSWQDVEIQSGPDESVIIATGSVVVHYMTMRDNLWSPLTLSAQRAVVFTDPGELDQLASGRLTAKSVRGIYLEGNVIATAGDNEYSVRAPRIYYDLRTNQAIMVESVLRTYSRTLGTAVYARAREMRQIAANQWTAGQAQVSTSDFYKPHFSLGARQVTVTQRPGHDPSSQESPKSPEGRPGLPDRTEVHIDSRDNTLLVGGLPVMYWPRYSGTVDTPPLKNIQGGYRTSDGAVIRTTWDPFALVGVDPPPGIDADVHIDGYTKRGPGAGLELTYDTSAVLGSLDLYGLHDEGVDRTSSGIDVGPPEPWRGIALWDNQLSLGSDWTVQTQLSAISDPTFVTSWRENDFYNRREYETAGFLKWQGHNSAFTALAKYNLTDFISNSYLLASRGYQVQKLPEFSYRRYGDSLLDLMTYSGETKFSRVKMLFESGTPNSIGVPSAAFPFGIGPNSSISAAFMAAGFPSDWVNRFDTRHEVAMPFHFGALNVMPYLAGRFTAYDDDFAAFSPDADKLRVFGAAGLRMNAQIQRVNDGVESELFGLHRLRHVLEPRATIWYGYNNVSAGAYPVFDQSVEAIGNGPVAEVGLRSVWQTKRGGPGRWRSVDFLTVDASAVFTDEKTATVTTPLGSMPTPQFFSYRPEYSQFGSHVFGSMKWLASDNLSVVGEATYDLKNDTLSRGAIGTELRHNPQLSTIVEYRYIKAGDSQLLEIGWDYQMTRKYKVSLRPQWDFAANDLRAISLILTRAFPDFNFTFLIRQDRIANEVTVGASVDLVEF